MQNIGIFNTKLELVNLRRIKNKKMMKNLLAIALFFFSSIAFAQNNEAYKIPNSLIPNSWGHNIEKDKNFPKNPGIFDKSAATRLYDNADADQINFIYADIISKKNNSEVGVIHFQFTSNTSAETESQKIKDDGTNRRVYLKKGSLISTVFCDNESDKNLVDKIANYFENTLKMERFFATVEAIPVDTVSVASSSDEDYTSISEVIMDTTTIVTSFKFDHYLAKTTVQKQQVPVNWKSNAKAQKFQKQIENIIQSTEPNFANFYTLVFVEKNSNYLGFMMDSRSGIIYETPTSCFRPESSFNFEKGSRLYIANICETEVKIDSTPYEGYEWDENAKAFKKLKKVNRYINE